MIISDLDYLRPTVEESDITVSGAAGTAVGTLGEAYGEYTKVITDTRSISIPLPDGSTLSIGTGYVFALAYDPPSSEN